LSSKPVRCEFPMDREILAYIEGLLVGLDPVERFERAIGLPDPWQKDVLRCDEPFIAVLASRQIGKSTTVGCLAWDDLTRGRQVLIAAPSERQSKELLRRIVDFRNSDPCPPRIIRSTMTEIEAANGGRVLCVPATDQARGFTVDTLILDEAAFLPDEAVAALLPMRKATGRVLMISTPRGRDGFFYETWAARKARRVFARSVDSPRLAAKVEFDQRFMSDIRFRSEHLCEFLGSGVPLISYEVLQRAVSDREALVL
jgi:hypothetical protein